MRKKQQSMTVQSAFDKIQDKQDWLVDVVGKLKSLVDSLIVSTHEMRYKIKALEEKE